MALSRAQAAVVLKVNPKMAAHRDKVKAALAKHKAKNGGKIDPSTRGKIFKNPDPYC